MHARLPEATDYAKTINRGARTTVAPLHHATLEPLCLTLVSWQNTLNVVRSTNASSAIVTTLETFVAPTYLHCLRAGSGRGDYCTDHTCGTKGCNQSVLDESYYLLCISHTCQWNVDSYRCGSEIEKGASCCKSHTCAEQGCLNARLDQGRYCEYHTCSQERCYSWRDAACGDACEQHSTQTVVPLSTKKTRRRRQPTQNSSENAYQDYGRRYLEGFSHGINTSPQDHEDAQRLFGNLSLYGISDQDPTRRLMEDMVNGAIERGGCRIEEAAPVRTNAVVEEVEDDAGTGVS
ncbi:hypothetical protein DL98DRAFT_532182 [Cadophora sp. DSE1049]|nr:hypothetical protein DL98DRAFT_532182 [Cadophora sp. DSE1049]